MTRSLSSRLALSPAGVVPAEPPVRATRADEVVAQLADDILAGRLNPGVHLDEHEIARQFGVSRTPVREALGQLAAMGLAEKRPHRGVIVAMISETRLKEMFTAMGELEAVAARLAAELMTPMERAVLDRMHRGSAKLVHEGATADYDAFNTQFHMTLYAGCHNSYLQDILATTRARLAPFRRAQFNIVGRLASSYAEHDAVVQAVLQADGDTAARSMRNHVVIVSAASAEYVNAHHAVPPPPAADAVAQDVGASEAATSEAMGRAEGKT